MTKQAAFEKQKSNGIFRIYYIFLFLLIQNIGSIAQPGIEWAKCYGGPEAERSSCFLQTSDKGFIIIGTTLGNG